VWHATRGVSAPARPLTRADKVFKRLHFEVKKTDVEAIVNCKPGVIEYTMMQLQQKVGAGSAPRGGLRVHVRARCKHRGCHPSSQIADARAGRVPMLAASSATAGGSPASVDHGPASAGAGESPARAPAPRGATAPYAAPAAGGGSWAAAMDPSAPGSAWRSAGGPTLAPAPPAIGGGGAAAVPAVAALSMGGGGGAASSAGGVAASADLAIIAGKDATIAELRETIEILELKMKKLEQLVKLKDQRIATLTARLGGTAAPGSAGGMGGGSA